MDDKEFLELAIKQSELSVRQGLFPSGALVVLKDKIIASETSDLYPGHQHAESKAVDNAFSKKRTLKEATLYASMEPCLMCITRAYWVGIRRIVYAIRKNSVRQEYYERERDNEEIVGSFNESIEYLQISELEKEALRIVKTWENKRR
jgi:tRNA(adenine34) deaminase